jgi:3-hydroxymyristoyl/3-hydroxydecanoyl-(acyl carrier protein) dehydratase
MKASGTWLRIPPEHPALAGHFPAMPVVPGALLLDEALHSIDPSARGWHIANVKFHRAVRPDEAMQLEWHHERSGALRVEIRTGQALVLSAAVERTEP